MSPIPNTQVDAQSPETTKTSPKKDKAKKPAGKGKNTIKVSANGKAGSNGSGNGLRKPMVRILRALAKSAKPLSRNQIAEKAQVDQPSLSTYIGAHDEKVRAANEKKRGITGLLTLGYVRYAGEEGSSEPVYEITAAGRRALEKVGK